ncbi:HNH endonuclease [Gemmata sp. G18]|uniref:HNH endonuclease n=1 Tax=Gemmata palustris TaxID=2822762 RepID=A0ABS5C368_9BACT|nr:HNH endonuclease [Gemmata palustris]MBP3960412.1 HNH endonuclease [Gemmata palustris]
MSAFSDVRRAEVAARAGHRCEYCHLPTRGQVATFPIDHISPRSAGGTNELSNLALTCPHCNAQKWTAAEGTDPETKERVPLFNPRCDEWDQHFEWAVDPPGELAGLTGTGRATVAILCMNAIEMVALRRLLAEVGLFPELR